MVTGRAGAIFLPSALITLDGTRNGWYLRFTGVTADVATCGDTLRGVSFTFSGKFTSSRDDSNSVNGSG